jgi:hypothetical protein
VMANVMLGVVIGFVAGVVLGWIGGRQVGVCEGAQRQRVRSREVHPGPVMPTRGRVVDPEGDSMAEWSDSRPPRSSCASMRVGKAADAHVSSRDVVDLDSLTVVMRDGAASSVGGDR